MERIIKKYMLAVGIVLLSTVISLKTEAQEYRYYKGMMRLPYKERAFHQDKPGSNALVLYLHPRSARGHNNETQEDVAAYKALVSYLDSTGMKAILLAPQCEEPRHWNEYSAPMGKYLSDVVMDFLEDYIANHDVDRKKVYALGESFGASGVWRLVTDYPGFFAAAMPAVCSPKLKNLEKYVKLKKATKTPLCLVAGERDQVYGPGVMKPFVEELKTRKCDLKYVILPGLKHYESCLNAMPTEGLDWLFQH